MIKLTLSGPSCIPLGRPRGRPSRRNEDSQNKSLLKKRTHVEQFLSKLEDLVKTHFRENVFFSEEEIMKVDIKMRSWKDKLESGNLTNEDSGVEGKVEFSMDVAIEK